MKESQRNLLKFAGLLILASFLFPPFESMHPYGGVENVGYGFIFTPPTIANPWGAAMVNTDMLLIEWIGIALLTSILWLLKMDSKSDN